MMHTTQSAVSCAAMNPWPSLAQYGKRLTLHGGELFYYDTGPESAEHTVALVHGLGDEADTWRHIIPVLAKTGIRVIAPDLPGFGRSLWKGGISANGHADALIQLLMAVNGAGPPRPALVAGNSMGAGIAELAAFKRPDLITGLALVDGCYPFSGTNSRGLLQVFCLKHIASYWTRFFAQKPRQTTSFAAFCRFKSQPKSTAIILQSICSRILAGLPFIGRRWYRAFRHNHAGAWRSLYPYYHDLDALADADRVFLRERVIARVHSANQERGYFASLRSMNRQFLFGRAAWSRKITAFPGKILLLWGDDDRIFPLERTAAFRSLRPDAGCIVIAEAGHLPQQEQPTKTTKALLDFLDEL
jgi:pimeloyl-ACP methyl ester carboxylesterase